MVDSWSAGCVLFMLISGKHPFLSDDACDLRNNIIRKKLTFEGEEWVMVSE